MSGFLRALQGELYLLTRRSSVRRAHLLVFAVAVLHVVGSIAWLHLQAAQQEVRPEQLADWNLWPRLAAGARTALYFVELLVLALIAGGLPREIAAGVAREPLTRRISRRAFAGARVLASVLLATSLYLTAVASALLASWLLFDAGPVVDVDGMILFDEVDVMEPVVEALVHGLPSVLALACFACLLSVALARGVLAVGVGLGIVLATGVFRELLGEAAPFWFADTLPGFGPDSFLEQAAGFARGLANYYPQSYDQIATIGWWAPWPVVVLAGWASVLVFRRRAL